MDQRTDLLRLHQAFPAEIRNLARWVPWSYHINPKGKRTKRPHGSTKRPEDWRTFADCSADGDGIGFVFTGRVQVAGGTLFAFDLDNCRHPDGTLTAWAASFLTCIGPTYVEVTPSGTGVRPWVIVRNAPAGFSRTKVAIDAEGIPGCNKAVEFQVFGYGAPQFVTCTGDRLPNLDRLEVIDDLGFLEAAWGVQFTDPRAAPVSSADAPAVEAIVAQLRNSPVADLIFNADWESAAGGRNDQSASGAFFVVAQAAMRAAGGNVDAALAFIQTETAWGRGDVAESADPARYGRPSWLRAELNRAAAKGNVPANVVSVFDDGFDFDAWVAPDAPPLPAEAAAPVEASARPPSPLLSIESPRRWFDAPPPPREYLLHRQDGEGWLPKGKVGLINAAGGTGKTTAIVQLAICVATGIPWFNYFEVPDEPRRVLLLLGEEDLDEVRRKLYWTAKALGLDPEQRAAAEELIDARPLAGHALPLLRTGPNGDPVGTEHGDAIVRTLERRQDWGLVVVDPVSRFTSVNVESDNVIATRYAQELERFTEKAFGAPVTLGIGHTSKAARKDGIADFRGVTGLFDAVRWAITLRSTGKNRVELKTEKNNLSAPFDEPVMLYRSEHGILSAETPEQARERDQTDREARIAAMDEKEKVRMEARELRLQHLLARIVEHLEKTPGLSGNSIADYLKDKRTDVLDALRRGIGLGVIHAEKIGGKVGYWLT